MIFNINGFPMDLTPQEYIKYLETQIVEIASKDVFDPETDELYIIPLSTIHSPEELFRVYKQFQDKHEWFQGRSLYDFVRLFDHNLEMVVAL